MVLYNWIVYLGMYMKRSKFSKLWDESNWRKKEVPPHPVLKRNCIFNIFRSFLLYMKLLYRDIWSTVHGYIKYCTGINRLYGKFDIIIFLIHCSLLVEFSIKLVNGPFTILYQKFHQSQCSKVVMWYRRRHVTSILLCQWW